MPAPAPLQLINSLVHFYHPLGVIVNWVLWSIVLVTVGPIGFVIYSIYCLSELLFVRYLPHPPDSSQAILITGCDSGFGYDLANAAVKAGYTVFAGCLNASNTTIPGATVVAMDVTNDSQVNAAIQTVQTWLKEESGRYLFALVNNAGVGRGDPVDFMDMKSFQFCMDGKNTTGLSQDIHAL